MGYKDKATDWEACGVAQVGALVAVGAGLHCFEFRSKQANARAVFSLLSVGIGLGGSMGGGTAPSPVNVAKNQQSSLFSSLRCLHSFSCEDLNHSFARIQTLSIAGGYGYSIVQISAGIFDRLFYEQDVSGWGTGVSIVGGILEGVWTGWQLSNYY